MPLFSSQREPSPEPVREAAPPKKSGLFHRRSPEPMPVQEPVQEKRHGLFHRRSPSPTTTNYTTSTGHSRNSTDRHSGSGTHSSTGSGGGIFRSGTNNAHDGSVGSGSRKPNILQRGFARASGGSGGDEADESIVAARERVMSAEAAEADADRALDQARMQVREAREHMKRVVEEAEEDARRAKIKQQHALEVSKRGQGLGRHGL